MRLIKAVQQILALVSIAAAGALAAGQTAGGQPKLVLSQEHWDFGTILHPQKAELTLELTNAGTAELRITDIKSSCSCTVAQPDKRVLAPGESTSLKIVYDSKNKQGKVQAQVVLHSNDPANPQQTFEVTGVVQRVVEVTPLHGLMFRVLDPDQPRWQEVTLVNTQPDPMQPRLGTLTSPQFSAELKEIEPGRKYVVRIGIRPPIRQRVLSDTLVVTTGLAAEPEIPIKIRLMRVDRIMLSPAAVYVKFTEQRPVSRTVTLEYFGDDPQFAVTGVDCPDPKIRIELSQAQHVMPRGHAVADANIMLRITLEFPPETQLPPDGLPFTVRTNDPDYPQVVFRATSDVELYRRLGEQVLREGINSQKP